MYSVGEVFCQSNTSISLSKNHHFDSKQASPTEELNVLYKLSQIKVPGTVKTKWQALVCGTCTVNGQKRRGGFEHMSESASRCSTQLLSPHCAPVCAGETQAHVETPIKRDTVGWHDGESSITVIAFKQTQVFCPVRLNVWQRQMQTHHSSQDCIWLGWIRRRGNRQERQ